MKSCQTRKIRSWLNKYLRSLGLGKFSECNTIFLSLSLAKGDSDTCSDDSSSIQQYNFTSWDISLITVTCLLSMNVVWFLPRTIIYFFTMASRPDMGTFRQGQNELCVTLNTCLHLLPKLGIGGALPTLCKWSLFTFLFLFVRSERGNYLMCKVAPLLHSGYNNVMLFLCHRNAVSVSRINVQYEICCLFILNNRINNS
jgi:hypothetical protein